MPGLKLAVMGFSDIEEAWAGIVPGSNAVCWPGGCGLATSGGTSGEGGAAGGVRVGVVGIF